MAGAPSEARKAVRRGLVLVTAFSFWTAVVGGLLAAALVLFLWQPWATPPRDPRADPGSQRDIPLKKGLHLAGYALPENAEDVHFYTDGNMMGSLLHLTYRIDCAQVPAVFADAEATVPVDVDGLEARGARGYAEEHGWRPGVDPAYAKSRPGAGSSVVMVAPGTDGRCAVYLEHFN